MTTGSTAAPGSLLEAWTGGQDSHMTGVIGHEFSRDKSSLTDCVERGDKFVRERRKIFDPDRYPNGPFTDPKRIARVSGEAAMRSDRWVTDDSGHVPQRRCEQNGLERTHEAIHR